MSHTVECIRQYWENSGLLREMALKKSLFVSRVGGTLHWVVLGLLEGVYASPGTAVLYLPSLRLPCADLHLPVLWQGTLLPVFEGVSAGVSMIRRSSSALYDRLTSFAY